MPRLTRLDENAFKDKTALECAEEVMGKIITLPDFTQDIADLRRCVKGRITELEIYHETGQESDKMEKSNLRRNFDNKNPGDIFVAGIQGGQCIAVKAGGNRGCFRLNAVDGVGDKASKITRELGITKNNKGHLEGTNVFDGDYFALEDDGFEVKELEMVSDKNNPEIIRKIRLKN